MRALKDCTMRAAPERIASNLRRAFRALLLTAFSCAVLGWSGQASTICVGSDGHVAIESRLAGRCADRQLPSAQMHDTSAVHVEASPACCGPCTDFDAVLASYTPSGAAKTPAAVVAPVFAPPHRMSFDLATRGIALHVADAVRPSASHPTSVSILRC
jgi:hypothetical protein